MQYTSPRQQRQHPLVEQAANNNITPGVIPDDCREILLWGGRWYVPGRGFRQLVGEFGEPLVRTVLCNAPRDVTPDQVTPAMAEVLRPIIRKAKQEITGR